MLPGGVGIPFPQSNGLYIGPPASDEQALEELQHWQSRGARYVVFTWEAFWWFEHYPQLNHYLQSRHPCLIKNERVVVYDLNV